MAKTILAFVISFSSLHFLYGQQLQFENQIDLNFNLQDVSLDSDGQLYLVSSNGELFKFNGKGDSLFLFSPSKNAPITLVDASMGLKIFVFYRDFQEYLLLDRFLRPSPRYSFNQDQIGFANLATISTDQSLWILDPVDFSLKKYETKSNQVEISSPLNRMIPIKDYEISFIKEYQNKLFIIDNVRGVYVFDNMGNYQKVIPQKGIRKPGFLGNSIYFFDKGQIIMINFHTGAKHLVPIPVLPATTAEFVRIFKNHIYLFEKERILIFRMI